jgi:hypothetical protein
LGTGKKLNYQLTPDFEGFWFFPEGFSELELKKIPFCSPCAFLHNPRKINTLPALGKHNLYIDNKISLILRLNNPVSFYFSNEIKISRLGTQSVRDI